MPLRYPEALTPGDLIAVVAPSSPFRAAEFFRGLAWLRGRYRLRAASGVLARSGYLAGDDARRVRELDSAMRDRDVRAIVAARGGYGATRITARLPWAAFAEHPKWIVGFSDITALHAHAWKHGVASVHGPNVTGLGPGATPHIRFRWIAALEAPRSRHVWGPLRVLNEGSAEGPLVGGNLALVEALAAAGALHIPEGAILALEDVTERPYRIDRMLTSLREGGYLDRLSGLVFGSFTNCDPGPEGVTVDEVLAERTRMLGVPVLSGAPFGHDAANEAFILGARVKLADACLEWVAA